MIRSAALAAASLLLVAGLARPVAPAWAGTTGFTTGATGPAAALVPAAHGPADSTGRATVPAATATGTALRPMPDCRPGTPATAPPTTDFFDPAHPEYGPRVLPDAPPVGPLLTGYQRFGGLTEDEFTARYHPGTAWIYPPDDGFLVVAGKPIEYPRRLRPGSEIDRFGYPGGSYLSPAGTPFGKRALPPQNLTTPSGTPESNYHLYCVVRPFRVLAGPIAPWFGQPGRGTQYKLDQSLLPQAGTGLSVTWLLTNGYLVEEDPARST